MEKQLELTTPSPSTPTSRRVSIAEGAPASIIDTAQQYEDEATIARLEKNLNMTYEAPETETFQEESPAEQIEPLPVAEAAEAPELEAEQPEDLPEATPPIEKESLRERIDKKWLIRTGRAAVLQFRIIKQAGVKNYLSDTIDQAKADLYAKTEATLWQMNEDLSKGAQDIASQYRTTVSQMGDSMIDVTRLWTVKREQAKAEKAKRNRYVTAHADRIVRNVASRRSA